MGSTGLFAIVGVLVGGIVSWAAAAYVNRKADRQKLRDARLARLRAAFAPILRSAGTLPSVVAGQKFSPDGETTEERDARLTQLLEDGSVGAEDAWVALRLEPGLDADVLAKIQEVTSAFNGYRVALGLRMEGQLGVTELAAIGRFVSVAVDRLGEAMAAVLDATERPVSFAQRPRWLRLPRRAAKQTTSQRLRY